MKNIIFIGTNNFAALILEKLIKKNLHITYILTKQDNKIGRGQKTQSYPVKKIAEKYKKNYKTIQSINAETCTNLIKDLSPKLIIVTDYGEKINNDIIKIPQYGILNIHPSILPKLRGPTPIQTAILNGDKETGVSIIKINNKIDSGSILNIMKCKINKNDTYTTLNKKIVSLSLKCLITVIKNIKNNKLTEVLQNENEATYTKKFDINFFKIIWKDTAINIERKIKALTGIKYPSTYIKNIQIKIINGKVLKKHAKKCPGTILNLSKYGIDIATKDRVIRIKNIQFQGKKINHIKNILNSNKNLFKIGEKFD